MITNSKDKKLQCWFSKKNILKFLTYDIDIAEGKVCEEPHISINAYYIEAVKTANKMADILNIDRYRDEDELISAFMNAFYDNKSGLFKDGKNTGHISIVGNTFPFAFGLCPDGECESKIVRVYEEGGIRSVSLFCSFLALMGFVRCGKTEKIKDLLLDEGAWLRIIREGGTTTFEGWGKDTKWNTSLFHLTMSYAAVFMAEVNLEEILG